MYQEETCPRKDPPPGVLVLPPGSIVVLDCGGQVVVDGLKVNLPSVPHRAESVVDGSVNVADHDGIGTSSSVTLPVLTLTGQHHAHPAGDEMVENATEEYGRSEKTHLDYTEPEDKTLAATAAFSPIIRHSSTKSQSELPAEETDREEDYEKGEEGERRVRELRRAEWKWNGRGPMREGRRDGVMLGKSGTTLSLSSLSEGDSGNYSCHRRGKMLFSLRVVVAAPPERLTLSCFKKSPSSKIRCEGTPSQPVSPPPQCYLILRKGYFDPLSRVNCSYSRLLSRCWCALEHQEEERRKPHRVSLCVTNAAGKATSSTLEFTPLSIIKPDPPSSVVVQQVEGQERMLRVTWDKPFSWKNRDFFYMLQYQLRYRPLISLRTAQEVLIPTTKSFTIRDAKPGLEYEIQIQAKDEYDGQWSDWTTPDTGYDEITEGSGITDPIIYGTAAGS
ncbi:interleukin-6 receptor subunit alpha [Aplochiton taeniatus]